MPSLYERLLARKAGARTAPEAAQDPEARALPPVPGVVPPFLPTAPLVYRRDLVVATSDPPVAGPILCRLPGASGAAGTETGNLLFYDTETTGLSGGNCIFLAGFARPVPGGVAIRQHFLADFGGEAAFLEAVRAELSNGELAVSYNGRSFDGPLITTRCIMNRLPPPEYRHLDLLYPARALWKKVHGDCSLGNLERTVLLRRRVEDVPGHLVPDIYLAFVKDGRAEGMGPVFSHNIDDLLSLTALFSTIEGALRDPSAAGDVDGFGLGRLLLRAGSPEAPAQFARAARRTGDARSLVAAVRLLRTAGRRQAAADLAEEVYDRWRVAAAGVELAKHAEHVEGDFDRARRLVDSVLANVTNSTAADELRKRRRRLSERIRRRARSEDEG